MYSIKPLHYKTGRVRKKNQDGFQIKKIIARDMPVIIMAAGRI